MVTELSCQENPDLWFSNDFTEIQTAKNICNTCPLKDRCYQLAVDNNEQYGVWGGELFSEPPREKPAVKTCRSGLHPWIEGQTTCKECRKITQDKYATKVAGTRTWKNKTKPRKNVLGGTCSNGHELTDSTTTIRSSDQAVICKKCISGQKTRDAKANSSRKVGSVAWE